MGERDSDLSFDVDHLMRRRFGSLKDLTCFAGQEPHAAILLLKQLFSSIV
jgi:hypothetical protein